MIIETWVALVILIIIGGTAFIALVGWFNADERADKAEQLNRELTQKNAALLNYTDKLKFKKELQEIKKWGEECDV